MTPAECRSDFYQQRSWGITSRHDSASHTDSQGISDRFTAGTSILKSWTPKAETRVGTETLMDNSFNLYPLSGNKLKDTTSDTLPLYCCELSLMKTRYQQVNEFRVHSGSKIFLFFIVAPWEIWFIAEGMQTQHTVQRENIAHQLQTSQPNKKDISVRQWRQTIGMVAIIKCCWTMH